MPDVRPSEGRLSNRRRTSILITCCLSIFIVMVDSTGVNLALPSISREMGASTSQLQWVIDAYLLVLASLMLLSGSMADRLGRRRIFSLGLLLFGLGSALCSVATGPAMLIATRALQAIGGSMLNPVAMAIITNTYPDARRRARAIGVWGAVVGIGMATGPLLGGLLVDAVNWRAVFWVNIPVVVAALILVHLIVPESRGTAGRRVDVGGQLLGILVMATLSFAIITGGEQGFDHIQVLASAAIGALALAAFILVERHAAEPLLDLRYFRSVPFSAATVVAVLLFMAFSGFMFVATLYLQDDLGKSPLHAGLLTMPIALGNALLAPVSGRIVGRRGPRPSMVAGAVALAVGGVMLTLLGPSTPLWYFVLAGFFVGGANGVTNSAITSTAVSGMPAARSGVAASIASTGRQVGQSLGVAILGASLNTGLTSHAAFTDAARPGWFMIIGLALAIGALGVISGSSRARDSEARITGTFS
ncbi:MFS transporter [Acidipropionibacterium acidipropionici]|nr:MFS transporter [Acidipropionibacterium acidipropionici]